MIIFLNKIQLNIMKKSTNLNSRILIPAKCKKSNFLHKQYELIVELNRSA